jgi:hypothetical protein
MTIDARTIEQAELDLEAARSQLATGLVSANVTEGTKLIAAAIAQAGAEIALAICRQAEVEREVATA